MSQWGVQLVIGRLLTDAGFRRRVDRGGSAYLATLRSQGVELSRTEIATVIETDPRVWVRLAREIGRAWKSARAGSEREGQSISRFLTMQQQRVLAGVCEGLRNKDIAAELGVSEGAVKATLQQLFRKLSVRRRVQLVRLALEDRPWRSRRPRSDRQSLAELRAHRASTESIAQAP